MTGKPRARPIPEPGSGPAPDMPPQDGGLEPNEAPALEQQAQPAIENEAIETPAAEAEEGVAIDDVLSGRFDTEAEAQPDAPAAPPKRVLAPQAEQPKLHKVLAQAGMGSRLEMEQLILEGRISVNNQPAHVGQRIQYGDQIKVNGRPIKVRIAPPPAPYSREMVRNIQPSTGTRSRRRRTSWNYRTSSVAARACRSPMFSMGQGRICRISFSTRRTRMSPSALVQPTSSSTTSTRSKTN